MASAAVELSDVRKAHRTSEGVVEAVAGLDLSVAPGELVAVMGPSGSGKSTLLNLVGGLTEPTSGEVRVGGRALSSMSKRELAQMRRRAIGYVFQDYNLISSMTAAENVALPLELDGWRPRQARTLALATLADFELDSLESRFPSQLSGGQMQRVAIARAVVGSRSLILADEPTGALDSAQSEVVMQSLRNRCDLGSSVLLVTHDESLTRFADRVVRLRDGRRVS